MKKNPDSLQLTAPEIGQSGLTKTTRTAEAAQIWSHLAKHVLEQKAIGHLTETNEDLGVKQKMLCEKLAKHHPDDVKAALEHHLENKPWFPKLPDLMPTIKRLENSRAALQARERARQPQKDPLADFKDDPEHVRKAAVAHWHETQKQELADLAEAADEAMLTPAAKAARDRQAAKNERWKDSLYDPPESVARLKASLKTALPVAS